MFLLLLQTISVRLKLDTTQKFNPENVYLHVIITDCYKLL